MTLRPALAALALLLVSSSAHAGVTVRKIGENSEIVRATGRLMVKGGEPKPNAPRLSYTCTLSSGIGWCNFSVVVDGHPDATEQKRLDVTHDDGDLIIAGTVTVSRRARTFEWDWLDGTVLVLVPGS